MATKVYDRSVFKTYFDPDDTELLGWVDNVLDKLVEKGIVANYILRADESDNPSNYEDYYRPIVTFFAYLVRLAREFEHFKENDFLANLYLENKGVFTCGDENLDQLAYSITNFLRRRAQRGGIKTIEKLGSNTIPDGEILSLVCWDELIFFKLGVAKSKHNSWNVDNGSACYRGCTNRYDLNIGYEYTEDVLDLSLYPIENSSYVFNTYYKSKRCIEIEAVPFGESAGVGTTDLTKKIVVDPDMNFEITFYVAQDITLENITFGCKAFDSSGNQVHLKSAVDGINSNFFFETRRLNQAGKFYMIRGILYSKDQPNLSAKEATLNIGFGKCLRMTEDVVSIIPYIMLDNDMTDDSDTSMDSWDSLSLDYGEDSDSTDSTSDSYDEAESIYLWNIKVTPSSLDYERCYLNNKNFIDVIIHNQNGKYNSAQIKDILRKYFIPYNTSFDLINLPREASETVSSDALLLELGDYMLLETGDRILLE